MVFIIGGNWKLDGSSSTVDLISTELSKINYDKNNLKIVVAPPYTLLREARRKFDDSVEIGSQNCSEYTTGGYTGEISINMVVECGCKWVILGHSERRCIFKEEPISILRKAKLCLQNKVKIIFCIGEPLETRESGNVCKFLEDLIKPLLSLLKDENMVNSIYGDMVFAYEPIWAIGTGKTACPDIIQETHGMIRKIIKDNHRDIDVERVRIIYGGSIKKDNAKKLSQIPGLNGFLIGGASIKKDFVDIINTINETL